MYSSEDLKRFYFHYQTEAMPSGASIEQFCLRNKVPYNIFSKCYMDTRKQIVEVQVDGKPIQAEQAPLCSHEEKNTPQKKLSVRILVEILMTNGLHISQKKLSCQKLKQLVEKQDRLC